MGRDDYHFMQGFELEDGIAPHSGYHSVQSAGL